MAKGNATKRTTSKIIIPFSVEKSVEMTQGTLSKQLQGFKAFKLISVSADSDTNNPIEVHFSNYKIVRQRDVNKPVTARPDRFAQEGNWLPVNEGTENVMFSLSASCEGNITIVAYKDQVNF